MDELKHQLRQMVERGDVLRLDVEGGPVYFLKRGLPIFPRLHESVSLRFAASGER